jgi:hypothetical protein
LEKIRKPVAIIQSASIGMRRVSKVRQEGPVQPYVPPVPPTSHALVQRKFTDLLRRSSDSVANQHQQTMGSQAVHHHLRYLEEKRRRTKKNPSMQEVLMTGTPTGKAAGKSKFRSLMQPSPIAVLSHPFGPELKQWEQGVEVECGKNWSREMVEMALQRGAHPSAQTPEAIQLFEEDIAYQVNGGFCEVVLASDLMKDPPKNLKISPVATVPQANRRPRIILDLSFPVRRPAERRRMGPKLVESVNHTTEALSPQAPVKLIGKVLQELFEFMAQAPSESDVLLGKVDLSDGFWRMIVKPEHRWNFCYVLPQQPGRPMRIVVPYALQMGWQESPPYFCTATETGRDVIHWLIESDLPLPRHPMEAHVVPDKVGPRQGSTMSKPWQVSVYVDDYILAVLSTVGIRFIRRVARASLYGIHSIFPPPIITGHTGGKDPISTKKLKKGDAKLATRKEILGFEGNGQARTWKLPATKRDPICAELRRLERQPRIKRQRLEKITGKLINATRIAPAAKGLMTPFFKALHTDPGATKIRKKTFDLHGAMRDMRELLDDLERRPTHVRELVQFSPSAVGMDDASKHGMGGFWVSHLFPPTVWRLEFPPDVQQAFGKGILTINDLELAAILMQQIALEHLMKLRHQHSEIFSDNISATVWATKLMVHADSVIATRLVRAAAMRARTTESRMPSVHHWPGELNPLADDTTRSFQRYNSGPMAGHTSTSNQSFLDLFSHTYPPPPQSKSWQMLVLDPALVSLVISLLRGATSRLQQWMWTPERRLGRGGASILRPTATATHFCSPNPPPRNCMSYWPLLPKSVRETWERADKSKWEPSLQPSATSVRPSNWPATETLGLLRGRKSSISRSPACSPPTSTSTQQPNHK